MSQDSEQNAARHTVLDVTEEQVARVYAQAYLAAANNAGSAGDAVEEVESLVTDVLDPFPALESTLGSALLATEQKEQILDRIFGGRATPRLLNFLKVLAAHERLGILRAVSRSLRRQFNEQSGRVGVLLSVASPLDNALQGEVATSLRTSLGVEPDITMHVDPSLIAGFVVRIGDTVYDSSVRTRFERARKAMIDKAIQRIETEPEKFFNGEAG